jgi:hypothetical protein
VRFGPPDVENAFEAKVSLGGYKQKVKMRARDQEVVKKSEISLDKTARHRMKVKVREDAITMEVDAKEMATLEEWPGALPTGTVALGIRSNDSKGGEVWYDNLEIRPPDA